MRGIILVEYDDEWPNAFAREAAAIRAAMGSAALRIDHVGSTSVPGLAAKPIIDIQVSVTRLKPLEPHADALRRIGFAHVSLPVPDDPGVEHADAVYPFFQKPSAWPPTHHVHLCAAGSAQERNHLIFRDYLRDHPNAAAAYLELKKSLADRHAGNTLESRERYSLGKTEFVFSILDAASAAGYTTGR